MRTVIIILAVIALVFALSMTTSQTFNTTRLPNPAAFRSDNKEVTFGVDGNIVWFGAVDPNLLEVAGSGALY